MSLDVLALEFTDMQLKYSKEISAFLDRASAFGQDRILIYQIGRASCRERV